MIVKGDGRPVDLPAAADDVHAGRREGDGASVQPLTPTDFSRPLARAVFDSAPAVVLVSVPFPGAVYAAFRIAQTIKSLRCRFEQKKYLESWEMGT